MSATAKVTILFTDVVGSVELRASRGDESAHKLMEAHFELIRRQIKQHSGQEVKTLGDGFMVAFSSARRAVDCAVALQNALADHNQNNPTERVQVRIGLNTGEAIEKEGDLFGSAVDAAARIMSKAAGGQILIPENTRNALGDGEDVPMIDRGPFWLKGFPERWRLYEVLWQEEKISAALVSSHIGKRTPFVGRESERADLRRFLDAARSGHGSLVMIGGEPGVGKTRITEELVAEAEQHGFLTLTGHCYEMEGAPPYIPFVEIIESTARTLEPESFIRSLGDAAPEAARLVPHLRQLFPEIPQPQQLPPDQERRFLLNSLTDFFERLALNRPILLILEDLHWADDSTLLLAKYLAHRIHEMPALIIASYRHAELDTALSLARTLEELNRRRLIHEIMLRPLPRTDVTAMLSARIGQPPPARLAEVIYSETEGNPFFVEEIFKHFSEEGRLFDNEGQLRSDIEISEHEVPKGIQMVIGRRLERVSEECRHVLSVAAIIGRAFDFELLEELVDLDEDAVFNAIDSAERAQLIAAEPQNGKIKFKFYHELIRQTLISELSSIKRRRMHLHVANTMERTYSNAIDQHATDLAHHLLQAGDFAKPQRTTRYLILAGDQALASSAFEDALQSYGKALSYQSGDDKQARAELLHKKGLAVRSLGRWEDALISWREALAAYEELGDAEAVGRTCEAISDQLLSAGVHFEEAYEIASHGLEVLGDSINPSRCLLLATVAQMLGSLPGSDYAAINEMFAQSLSMANKLGENHLLGPILSRKLYFHNANWQGPEGVEAGKRGADILRSAGDLYFAASALAGTQVALVRLGRLEEAEKIHLDAEPLAKRTGMDFAKWLTDLYHSLGEMVKNADLNWFEERIRGNLQFAQSVNSGYHILDYAYLAQVQFWRGRWGQAREILRKCSESDALAQGRHFGACFVSLPYLISAYSGDKENADLIFQHVEGLLPQPGKPNSEDAWAILEAAVEGLAVLERRKKAAELYPLALEAIATGNLIRESKGGLVQTTAGIAAAAGGQWKKAEEHYETAMEQAHAIPHKIEQPEVRRWYARMLIERSAPGDKERAQVLLSEAIEMYREIGMLRHLEMAEELSNNL